VSFLDADLKKTRFLSCRLEFVDFSGCNLANWFCAHSSFRYANLSEVENLDPRAIQDAFGVKSGVGRTLLPEGIEPPEHWHVAQKGETDTAEAKNAYEATYRNWLKSLDENANP
jgi:hypothetical protein